jgi:hypothetical protein
MMPEERNAMLRRGNAIRLARSQVRRAVKRRRMDIRDALDHPAVQTMPVMELLAYLPGRRNGGSGKQIRRADALARRIAKEAWVHTETVTVADLSPARRDRVAEVVWQTAPGCEPPVEAVSPSLHTLTREAPG